MNECASFKVLEASALDTHALAQFRRVPAQVNRTLRLAIHAQIEGVPVSASQGPVPSHRVFGIQGTKVGLLLNLNKLRLRLRLGLILNILAN